MHAHTHTDIHAPTCTLAHLMEASQPARFGFCITS